MVYPAGSVRVLPPIPAAALVEDQRYRALNFFSKEAGFHPAFDRRIRQHTG